MNTYTLPATASPARVRRHLRFTTRRTGARAETAALHTTLSAALSALVAGINAVETAHEDALDESANVFVLDEELDVALADLSARALLELGRDRNHASYKRAFPTAPSAATQDVASDAQAQYAQNALDVMSGDPLFAGLLTHIAAAQTALDTLKACVALRDEKKRLEARARQELEVTKLSAVTDFNSARPSLLLLFPNKKGLVKSFFLTDADAKGSVE